MTMRAAWLEHRSSAPHVVEIDAPVAAAGQTVVTVEAAGLNPVDISMASGTYPGSATPVPGGVGREGVGHTSDGRRVYFAGTVAPWGSFAEQVLVLDDESLFDVPEDVDASLATGLGVAGMAGWLSTTWRGRVTAADTVLVLGASGVVGQVAVQAARIAGASRIIAAARSEDALSHARGLGADETVVLDSTSIEEVTVRFRAASHGSLDLVIDPLWGVPGAAALDALSPHGRLVQLGQSAGAEVSIRSGWIRNKMIDVHGFSNRHVPLDVRRTEYARMLELATRGVLTIEIESVPLTDIADAWHRQQQSPGCKLVIDPTR